MAAATTTQLKSAQRRQTLLKRKRAGILVLLIGSVIFTVQVTCTHASFGLHNNGIHCLEWIVPLLIGGIILGVAAESYYNEFVRVFEGTITSLYIEVDGYGICDYVVELTGSTAAGETNVNRLTVARADWRQLQVGQSYRV